LKELRHGFALLERVKPEFFNNTEQQQQQQQQQQEQQQGLFEL